jgi:hypothetical protein
MIQLLTWVALTISLLCIAGLVKPWWVLWWKERNHRMMVLQHYGLPAILLWLLIGLLHFFA